MILGDAKAATIRLVDCSWANYLQRALKHLKNIGHCYRNDGALDI
jgi:hypothetical protein